MFRKSTIVAVPALLLALLIAGTCDSAFARGGGGHGGGRGGRGGGFHSMSRHYSGRSMRSSRMRSSGRRSTNHMYAHNQMQNRKSAKNNNKSFNKNKNNKNQHHKHHRRHRHHRGYGSGDGDGDGGDDDGGDDGDGGIAGAGVDPYAAEVVPAPVTILNPAATGQMVNYTLGSDEYSIAAGQSRAHNEGTQVIAFDRGGSFGQSTYTLQPGTYRFMLTSTGWDLRTVTDQVADASTAEAE